MIRWHDLYTVEEAGSTWIKHDHVRADGKIEFSILVMRIYAHETDLEQGRFERFDHAAQEWEVRVRHINTDQPWWVRCEPLVGWIVENTTGIWSLGMDMQGISEGDFVFSFDDDRNATFFKLMFK